MEFNIKISYNCEKVGQNGPDGETGFWPSDDISVILPADLQAWADRFTSLESPEVGMFLTENSDGATLSIAACPQAQVHDVQDAERQPGGAMTFVLDLSTLKQLHAALGLAISRAEAGKE